MGNCYSFISYFVYFISYVDRASIGYAIDNIAQEFNLSDWQIGLVLGAFGVGYVVTAFLGGLAADKFGAKRTMVVAILFWSVGSFCTGISFGFLLVFLSRFILGLAEGPSFPSMTKAISEWLSAKEYNQSLSLAIVAVPVALALGGPIVSQFILTFSWRGTYYFLALLSLIWIPVWWWLFHDKPEDSPYVSQNELAYLHESNLNRNYSPLYATA
ncbi:MAG: MFS transporter [Legionella sp.]